MATGGVSPETDDPMICHICMEVYRNPKFLPCFHSFCAQCIQDWAGQNRRRSRSSFQCPACRQETSLPKGGVEKLQTNFYLNEKTLENARIGKVCRVHQNKVLELFCVPCQRVICLKCGELDHGSHQILNINLEARQKGNKIKAGYGFRPSCRCFSFLFVLVFMLGLVCDVHERPAVMDFETFEKDFLMPFKMEQFKCAKERDTEVYSLCVACSYVVVSYTQRGLKKDAASQSFTKTGQMLAKHVNVTGKATWARVDHTCVFFGSTNTFSKSKELFALSKASSNVSVIDLCIPYTLEEPVEVHIDTFALFTINVQKFRTFDADSTGNFFAVVEEKSPNLQRTVKIFRKPYSTPFATYAPRDMTFQPADVCFYEKQGVEVLLVADEWNQHIHVVKVNSSVVTPLGYLESGCPEFRTPTALNVDAEGDLWVACKGGSIVKIKYLVFYLVTLMK